MQINSASYAHRQNNAAKRYLKDYRHIEGNLKAHIRKYELLRNNLDRVSELFERATKTTSSLDAVRVSSSPQQDGMANAVLEMVRLKEYAAEHMGECDGKLDFLLEDMQKLSECGKQRLELMERMSDARYTRLLFLRYVCGMHWEAIAREMAYGVDNVYKLHGKALKEANDILAA